MSNSSGSQKVTIWFVVGFLLLGTIVTIVAAVNSSNSTVTDGTSNIPAPAITASDWSEGPKDAKVTLIEYGDFQCPACGTYYTTMLSKLVVDYKDKVLFVFRNFPLYSIHPNASGSSQAAEAAGLQGKYWEMYDMLYQKQGEWSSADPRKAFTEYFDVYAKNIGLDVAKFNTDANSPQVAGKIKVDVDGANAAGVHQTPTFYVNLKQIQNPSSYSEFKSILDAALASS